MPDACVCISEKEKNISRLGMVHIWATIQTHLDLEIDIGKGASTHSDVGVWVDILK